MSSSWSDADDQTGSPDACFYCIPSKFEHEQSSCNSNPDSNFYVIKNTPQLSSSPSSLTTLSRSGNARTLFTIVPQMPQDTITNTNVRCQLLFFFLI